MLVESEDEVSGRRSLLGIRREEKTFTCRLNGEDVRRRSQLAEALPVLWIGPESQAFLSQGPDVRRRFLDMGLFHVEHRYLDLVTEFQRTLRQRNAAIRHGITKDVRLWDHGFIELALRIDEYRQGFAANLMSRVVGYLQEQNWDFDVAYRYRRGWRQDRSLEEQLADRLETDMRLGYTGAGPHRAELELTSGGLPLERTLSRGQQKLLVFAFHLQLLDLIRSTTGQSPVLLIDDLSAELDQGNRYRMMEQLAVRPGQVFVTAIDRDMLLKPDDSTIPMFHVEHGALI